MIKNKIKELLHSIGYDLSKYSPRTNSLARRSIILQNNNIDLLIDVGANSGQYAKQCRGIGYKGRIVSFEPLSVAYKELEYNSKSDSLWNTYNRAIGDKDGVDIINIAGNSWSSSLLSMLENHVKSAPQSKYIGEERINISKLDSILPTIRKEERNIYLKMDTQGYESKVLKGAERTLEIVKIIQMEMSLVPLYNGEVLFPEMNEIMYANNYHLISIETGFTDPINGYVLQLDGIYMKNDKHHEDCIM